MQVGSYYIPRVLLEKEFQHAQKSLTSALITKGCMPEPSSAEQNTGGEATVSDFPASSSSKRLLLVAVDGTLS